MPVHFIKLERGRLILCQFSTKLNFSLSLSFFPTFVREVLESAELQTILQPSLDCDKNWQYEILIGCRIGERIHFFFERCDSSLVATFFERYYL